MKAVLKLIVVITFVFCPLLMAAIINVPGDSPTIQMGVNSALDGDTVLVAPGTYFENVNFNGTSLVLSSLYLTTGDSSYISSTIINGNSSGAVITVSDGEDSTSKIVGFSIESGSSSGVRVSAASPQIVHNIFRNNTAGEGGAINYQHGSAIIAYNEITGNTASQGAAMWIQQCSGNVYNNLIHNNLATSVVCGILVYTCDALTVNNNTICFNEAMHSDTRGGIYIGSSTQISIYNNILANNEDCGMAQGGCDPLELSIGYNDIFGNTFGPYWSISPSPSDLFLNPLFVGGDPFLFYLREGSPCIDAGDPNSPLDPDGTIADIGAFYFGDFVYIPAIVSGIVVDENAVPIESVFVQSSFPYYGAYSDLNGLYELAMWNGTYDITFQKSGYFDYTAYDITAASGDTLNLDVILYALQAPCTSCVRGLVENRESAQIESVYVSAVGTGVDDYTDFIGRYSLDGLPEGAYNISFAHQYYLDTTIVDIVVVTDSATTLDVLLEGNGAIMGAVVDANSQPISGVDVSIGNLDLSGVTDDYGEYFIDRIIPEYAFDVLFTHDLYYGEMLYNVTVGVYDTLVLDTVVMFPGNYGVLVWYGNPDGSTITAPIGDTISIDVYVQNEDSISLGFLHLPLGTDDQFIVGHHSITEGVLFSPLTEWDDVQFLYPNVLSSGWKSQSLLGFSDLWGGPNPYLQCPVPTRIASFALEIVNDTSLVGDTISCFMEGYHPANGEALFGDTTGTVPYYPIQFFSQLYLTGPMAGDCQYVPGDVNNSGGYNGLDITFSVIYLKGGQAPFFECECTSGNIWYVSGDVNGSCNFSGMDVTYGVAYFKGGPDPIPCSDCPPTVIHRGFISK